MRDVSQAFTSVRDGFSVPAVIDYYSRKSAVGLEPEEKEIVDRYVARSDSVLLVGGGGGREALALVSRGNRVTALDLSTGMLQAARRNLQQNRATACFVAANCIALCFRPRSFDHVFFCDGVYGHIPGRRRREAALREAAPLSRSGYLMVHCGWLRPAGIPSTLGWLRVLKQWLTGNTSAREPGDAVIESVAAGVSLPHPCFYHYFQSSAEAEAELRNSGLELAERRGGLWVLKHH